MISNKDFTIRDGIFLSYKDTEDNYKKIIQPLDDFFKRYDIKTFCMRESDEVYTAKGGENFVDLECEFICEKTLLFVAFITPEYLDSSECAREIDLMKSVIKKMNGDFDEPKILVLFDDASLDESILKMKRQSWYDSSIIGETNIYYHSSNLDAAKQEILKIFCKKLPKAYEAHQQRKESYYKKEFEKSHLMSDLVLHSLEQTYACTTVSKYILQSHELTDKRSGYEMHIITDEIKNYDMTVLSSMAIALNLQKNVKYIYYGAPETKEYFGKLKEVIKTFVFKNDSSRRKVDRYIRYTFDCQNNISLTIAELDNIRYEEFITAFPSKLDILKKYKSDFFGAGKFKEAGNIICWLRGRKASNEIGKDGYNYQYIERFNDFLKQMVSGEESNTNYIAVYFKKIEKEFDNLVRFSNWNVGSNSLVKESLEKEDITELEDFLGVREEFRDWIGYNENEGEANLTLEEVDEILDRMHFIALDTFNDELPQITYSFCIFYEQSDEQNDIYSAWYRTATGVGSVPMRLQNQEHLNLKTERDIDNDLVMYTANNADNCRYLEMFYKFLKSSSSIRKQLESIGSSLYVALKNRHNQGVNND